MKFLSFVIIMLVSAFASADYCSGKVLGVYISHDADVIIKGSWRGDWTRICNLKSSSSVDVVTCSLWASYAANALQNKTDVTLLYNDGGATACATLPTYQSTPTPYYFMLNQTN